MDCEVLGWPPDGPKLRLDHERFAYAGKFVMTDTGKAVAREDGELVAAAAFSPDRTDETVLRIRYITVRTDRRGEGMGPVLARFLAEAASGRGYDRVKIAVNNPFAYEAMYKAGFAFTGEETGLAELVLVRPGDRTTERYREGYRRFADRDLQAPARAFVTERTEAEPPETQDSRRTDR